MAKGFLEGKPTRFWLEHRELAISEGKDDRVLCKDCRNRALKQRRRTKYRGFIRKETHTEVIEIFECKAGCGACIDKPHRCYHYIPKEAYRGEIKRLREHL